MPRKKGPELHNTHIRIPQDAYEDMMTIAKKYRKPLAWVIRLIITDSLRDAASYVRYADEETGKRVMQELDDLNKTQMQVRYQIRAIGNNVNQLSHEAHIQTAILEEKGTVPAVPQMSDEQVQAIRDSLDDAMRTYERAAEKAGSFKWSLK